MPLRTLVILSGLAALAASFVDPALGPVWLVLPVALSISGLAWQETLAWAAVMSVAAVLQVLRGDAHLTGAGGAIVLMACLATAAVDGERRALRLRRMATRDSLTGLANRGEFLRRARARFLIARRYHQKLACCICDLDGFKAINDGGGHLVGDRVLAAFAQHLQKVLRESDVAGRLGGDEFAVLFPLTDCEQATLAMQRLRQELVRAADMRGTTATFGIAELRDEHAGFSDLLHAADAALYSGKRQGKARVVAATPTMSVA